MPEVKLSDILNDSLFELQSGLRNLGGIEAARQIDKVIVPVQKVAGTSDNFSVMAFPYPRLTLDERKSLPLVDEESYVAGVAGTQFKFDLDQFGQINWLHVQGAPHIYEALTAALKRAVESGDYKSFWEH